MYRPIDELDLIHFDKGFINRVWLKINWTVQIATEPSLVPWALDLPLSRSE
jgi:hypothetical protein